MNLDFCLSVTGNHFFFKSYIWWNTYFIVANECELCKEYYENQVNIKEKNNHWKSGEKGFFPALLKLWGLIFKFYRSKNMNIVRIRIENT